MGSLTLFVILFTISSNISYAQQRRYVIDNDNDLNRYFAFPIDTCFQAYSGQFPQSNTPIWLKYACAPDNETIVKYTYSDLTCGTYTSSELWTNNTSPCGTAKFSCSGIDEYGLVNFYQSAACIGPIISVPLVSGCYCDGSDVSYLANCENSETASIISYESSTCNGVITDSLNVGQPQCEAADSLEITSTFSIAIYAQIEECKLSQPVLPPKSDDLGGQSEIDTLEVYYYYIVGSFASFFGMIAFFSFIDAYFVRINDYYKIGAIMSMILQTIDMMSDCFFTFEVSIRAKYNGDMLWDLMLYLSIISIVLPSFIGLFQLYFYAKKHWLSSDDGNDNNDYVRAWISRYSAFLLFMSLGTGSSFSAVALLNSYIFQIELFDMGLTEKMLKGFHGKRIWSVVILENMPQLCLQGYYLLITAEFQNNQLITISSMAFSVISVIISIMSITMERAIRKTQRYTVVSIDVLGDCVEEQSSKCRTMNFQLRKNIAVLIGVNYNVIEVIKPMYITHGLSMDIIIYINADKRRDGSIKQLLRTANKEGNLAKIIKHAWKLDDLPKVRNIMEKSVESSQGRKRMSTMKVSKQSLDLPSNEQPRMKAVPSKSSMQDLSADEDMPPPPKYNANAKRASRKDIQREMSRSRRLTDSQISRKQTFSVHSAVAYDDGSEMIQLDKEESADVAN